MIPTSRASPLWSLVALLVPAHAAQYPIGITNCGVSSWINGTPSRAVAMNQGATEMLLALNLSSRMVGTAYLDDEIWPEVAEQYSAIPVLSATYPTVDELLAVEPDFVFASYASAFQLGYVNTTSYAGECDLGNPNEDETNSTSTSCRQELNDRGIQAYLQVAACEQAEHRPVDNSASVVFEEIWEIATIFDAFDAARQLVDSIDNYFDLASELSSRGSPDPVKILWLDAWNDEAPSVGVCCGSVQTIIRHSGAKNIFEDVGYEDKSTWTTVPWEEIIALDPDVVVVVDASWERAGKVNCRMRPGPNFWFNFNTLFFLASVVEHKIFNLCNNTETRKLRAVRNRAFISIPFSGATLGVRMGSVAYNLAEAVAALTRNESLSSISFSKVSITSNEDGADEGAQQAVATSGVKVYTRLPVFNGTSLESFCPGSTTQVQIRDVPETGSTGDGTSTTAQTSGLPAWSIALLSVLGGLAVLAVAFVAVMISREKKGKPLFNPLNTAGKDQSVWA